MGRGGSPVQAGFAPSQETGSLLFYAKQDLFVLSKPMFCLRAAKYIVKTQAVAFGLQLGAWQGFLLGEVRGEAKDIGNIFSWLFGQVINVFSKE